MTRIFIYADDEANLKEIVRLLEKAKETEKFLLEFEKKINSFSSEAYQKADEMVKQKNNAYFERLNATWQKIKPLWQQAEKANEILTQMAGDIKRLKLNLKSKVNSPNAHNERDRIAKLREEIALATNKYDNLKKEYDKNKEKYSKVYRLVNHISDLRVKKHNEAFADKYKLQEKLINEKKENFITTKDGAKLNKLVNLHNAYKNKGLNKWYQHLKNLSAKGNKMATLALKNGDTGYVGGYNNYSMSKSASNAYENGSRPLSAFKKQDAHDMGQILNKKMSVSDLRDFLKYNGSDGYHHTSKFYNKTNFFSAPKALHGDGKDYKQLLDILQ